MAETRPNQADPASLHSADDYCNSKWNEAMKLCELNLSEAERAYFSQITSFEAFKQNLADIEKSIRQQSGPGLLQRVAPVLDPLMSFATLLTACLSSSAVETAIAASRTEALLPETISMVEDLGHDLDVFAIHGKTFANNPRIADELMDIFVEIIMSWTRTIHFLNRNKFGVSQKNWPSVREKFENTLQRIRKRAEQIKEKATALSQVQGLSQAGLLQELDRMGLISGGSAPSGPSNADDAVFPCCNIPFSRNNNFFGREDELDEIKNHLDDQASVGSFRSFALYGTGGIGKTQTALAYAYGQKDAGTDAILWFNCETGISMARSFADAASLLQLEGIPDEETSDQNKFLVLRWLRRTKRTWLCVFDNVEDLDIFRNAWPVADSGKVLVTSRNDIVSIDPAAGGMEIKAFDQDKGCDMILRHVSRPSYSDSEVEAARTLTGRLGGLALALVIMASQIRLRKLSISSFVQLYAKHATKLNKETRGIESYYKLSLATCWQTTFNYLSPNASSLLGVIAHLGPDALPEELFHPLDSSKLPRALEFCADDWLYVEALEELLSTSVIRKDPEKNLYFIHRLTQEEFRGFLSERECHDAFISASQLLCEAFPKLVLGQSMRLHWPECKRYIQHVLMLCHRWQEAKYKPRMEGEFDPFLLLSTGCGWYLMESGAWSEEIILMDTAMEICQDKQGMIYAILANSRGEMECERGHCDEAYKYMRPSLEIFRRMCGDNHPEVGSGFNNYANIVLQDLKEGACEEAIESYHKALKIFDANGPDVYKKLFHIPHTNLARAYTVLQQYDQAIYHAEQSRKWAVEFLGEGCHFDGLADYHVGNALFAIGKHDEAEQHWLRALDLFKKENEVHPTTNAAKIKLAMVNMERGDYDEAISMLQKVLIIAKLMQPSKGDSGEVARVQRKLAEAYNLRGDVDRAESLRLDAERMRRDIQGERFPELPDCDLSYAMMSFHAFW